MGRSVGVLAVAATALLLSCGDGGGDASTVNGFAVAFCDLLKPCCAKADLRTDGVECKQLVSLLGSAGYDGKAGEACLAELRSRSGEPTFCRAGATTSPACEKVFEVMSQNGTKAPGQPCESDFDCAASSEGSVECVRKAFGSEMRMCQVRARGNAGDKPCVGTALAGGGTFSFANEGEMQPTKGYLCHETDALQCDFDTLTCVALKQAGEECRSSSECAQSTYCDFTAGKCMTRKPLGAACKRSFATKECSDGGHCAVTGMCEADAPDGATCMNSDECSSEICMNGKCAPAETGDIGLLLICGMKS